METVKASGQEVIFVVVGTKVGWCTALHKTLHLMDV